ncbi:unnamed protein product [Tenebrio molitor]|nr:unnamed protein product [Tenebrio molitor]
MLKRTVHFLGLVKNGKYKHYSTKLSYVHNIGEKPLRYITIGDLLEEAACKFSERKAIISRHQNKSLTFAEILVQADKLAAGLTKVGVQRKDRVGLWAPNLIEWYITKLACARAGLIMVGLNPANEPSEIEYCVNKVGIKTMVCGNKFKSQDYYESLLMIAPELKKCDPGKLKSARVPALRTVITMSENQKRGTYNFQEIINLANNDISYIHNLQNKISPDEACNLQFTSGTTGKPKAVVCSHFSIVNNGYLYGKRNELSQEHTICSLVPFFHIFGIMAAIMAPLSHGSTIVLPTDGYDPNKSLAAIKEERCTIVVGTPTMYVDLVHLQEERKLKISLEMASIGGALCTSDLMKKMLRVLNLKTILSVYGLSETSGALFQGLKTDTNNKILSTVGCVSEHVEAKVIDNNGNLVPCGTAGELCVRTYSNMLGYWEDEETTKNVMGQDGWLKTRDQFILNEDGYGQIVGRFKEMIIRGGENIYPKEIEEFLNTHPNILETHVIGTSHARLGEEICACIRIKPGSNVTSETIANFCIGQLAYFKIPSKIKIMDEFPRTTSGKVQKFKLKEMIINSV